MSFNSKKCKNCGAGFAVHEKDRDFYKRIDVPEPTICSDCRSQKRLAYRNERTLYKRDCDLCKKPMVTIFSTDKPFPVYCQDCFWGDKWNGLDFGRDFDFNKPFFPQFYDFLQTVPRLAIVNKQSQNSDYCNYSFANKNCYLTFGNHYEEDCLYGHYATKNKDCVDYLYLYGSELCYECLFSKNCYRSVYLDHCDDCQDCYFSTDLKGCKHCLFCSNLRHKEYHIFNKPYSKEEYLKKLESGKLDTYSGFSEFKRMFLEDFRQKFPFRAYYQVNCEDSEGNNLKNSKNLRYCFDCTACEDCGYGFQMDETYSSMDMNCMGYDRSEVCYHTIGCSGIFNCLSCDSCWHDSDLRYCNMVFSSKNCFGCISLQHAEYCIFNKKYSKEEYEKLAGQIIEHMQKTGEWGEFFPMHFSPFAYNETVAQEYFPLDGKEASAKDLRWKDPDKKDFQPQSYVLPDSLEDVPDSLVKKMLVCTECGRNYKIVPQELEFYRKLNLPIPRKCLDCRHQDRMKMRNPRKLWERKCEKCGTKVQTCYATDRSEKVHCEKCYLETVN